MNVAFVALYRYLNFPIRIFHSISEEIKGITAYSYFIKDCTTNEKKNITLKEAALFIDDLIKNEISLVCFSVLSPFLPDTIFLTQLIKKKTSATVLWGGIHPTLCPDECINNADIICLGEGEGAIKDLLIHFYNKTDFSQVKNLWIKTNDQITKNAQRSLISNLDEIPFAAFGKENFRFIDNNQLSTLDTELYRKDLYIFSSRGCPYACSFCINGILKRKYKELGSYIRKRSVASLISEIKQIIDQSNNQKKYVQFIDECFYTDNDWIDLFCEEYKEKINLPFRIKYNPLQFNETNIIKLKNAGLVQIMFGMQTGSDLIRNKVFTRKGKTHDVILISKILSRHRIITSYDLILNNPYDSIETILETMDFIVKVSTNSYFMLYSLTYFPDYPLTKMAEKDHLIRKITYSRKTYSKLVKPDFFFIPHIATFSQKKVFENIIWLYVFKGISKKHLELIIKNRASCKYLIFKLFIISIFQGFIYRIILSNSKNRLFNKLLNKHFNQWKVIHKRK